jgi:hypothetical protein
MIDIGAYDYVPKPFSPEILELRVERALKESSYNKIKRSIEFSPGYVQAGLNILHFFGKILETKFPDSGAKIKIEQEGLTISMVIDPGDGDIEIIEKELNDYSHLINKRKTVDEYTDDKILSVELKNQINIANAILDIQKNQIEYKNGQIDKLLCIVGDALNRPPQFTQTLFASASSESTSDQCLSVSMPLTYIHDSLDELKRNLPGDSKEKIYLEDIKNSINEVGNTSNKDLVRESSVLSKLNVFLENVEKADSVVGKIIKRTKDGIQIAQKIAKYYNDIAQWCGLPSVPKPFIGNTG